MQKFYFFTLFTLFCSVIGISQTIPDDEFDPICDGESISTGAPGNTGINNLTIPCNTAQPLSPYLDFYYVRILAGSTFTFVVDPVGNDDYDFGAWLNPNWDNINSTPNDRKRGSQNDPFQSMQFNLGLSLTATDLCETGGSEGSPEPGMVRYFDVVPGDEILIAIDRWSNTTQGYTISFGGNAELDCTILGNSYGKCDLDGNNTEEFVLADFLPDLQDEYPGNNYEFYNDQTNAENDTGPQISFPYAVNYNGGNATEIFVRVETSTGALVRVLKIFLYVNRPPQLLTDEVSLPVQCDDDGDGEAVFNLVSTEPNFVNAPSLYTFKYYETEADANAGGTNIINPANAYESPSGTVYVRIETGPLDGNELGCYSVGEIHLEVSDFDVDSQTLNMDTICDEDGNDTETVDLTLNEVDLVADPTQYIITYHTTQTNADNGTAPIPNPGTYNIPAGTPVTIYVRIQHLTDPCFTVSYLNYTVTERPDLNPLDDESLCVDETTGDYLYDLTNFNALIIDNPLDYTISFYESLADAQVPQNEIANPAAYPIPVNSTRQIFIRVEKDGCPNFGDVEITVNSNPEVGVNIELGPICDEDGDGSISVNFTENEADLVDNPANYDITYHLNEADAEAGINPIANPNDFPINAGQTLTVYIRVGNLTNDCYAVRSITYQTVERPVLNDMDDVDLCVEETTGNHLLDLSQFNSLLINDPEDYQISYYESQADADAGVNPINPVNAYPIPVNTTVTVYARVETEGCFDTRSFSIRITSNPVIQDLPPQTFCSTQDSGNIIYDLTQHLPEWLEGNTQDLDISYHISQTDADNGLNPIASPENHSIPVGETTHIYVRAQVQGTDCYATTILTLYPGVTATLNEDLTLILCDDNFDEIFVYDLTQLNGQLNANPNNFEFAYYLNQTDAENDVNPIPETQWSNFQMNFLPQEIWVVATSSDECRSVPVMVRFEQGDDIPLITEIIGPEQYCIEDVINLHEYESQITNENANFNYHNSLSDAQNGLNPILNTDEFLPEGNNSVFVRLEQAGSCPVIAEIQFELLPTPSIELNQTSFELCPGDSFVATATSDDPDAQFVWYLNNAEIGTGTEYTITENGTYLVQVTGSNGCVNEATLTISTPPTPIITGIESGSDYIIVSANSGDGGGMLDFSIDGVFWQNDPKFSNLTPGETYTIYVREDGCMVDSYEVAILLVPNFISPNGDGKNDTWEIRGIEITPNATIQIFDRYGKIFVDTNFEGNYVWDGKYLGRSVPSGEYWYIMQIPGDGIIKPQKFVGHISIRN